MKNKTQKSTTFVYELINRVETRLDGLFEASIEANLTCAEKRADSVRKILEFRLIGKCSLDSITVSSLVYQTLYYLILLALLARY